jgi:pSer/pThr/pTyr-binding forkhead associated (FHA) protein
MAKLVLSSGGAVVQQCFVDKQPVDIGRHADNGLVIDDPEVDARHATVVPIGNDHILEDLQGAGTLINGVRMARHILQHGDVMQFGAFYLRYLNPRSASEVDLERTMLISGLRGSEDARRAGPAPAVRPRARGNQRFPGGRLRIRSGQRAGEAIALDRVIATLGLAGAELAVVARRPSGYFITHVAGRRSPRVNGRPIGSEARPLHHGDRIEVGSEAFELELD